MSKEGTFLKPGIPRLQNGDRGFSIDYNYDPEIPLAPGESRDFLVIYEGKLGDEVYTDSIGVGEGDYFSYIGSVVALGARPEIHVEKIYLDNVQINTTRFSKGVTISNWGAAPLIITGYKGPTLEEFRVSLSNWGITPETPLIIQPGNMVGFDLYFTPREPREYLDSIVFETQYFDYNDNICYLRGIGVDSTISVKEESPIVLTSPFNAKVLPNPLDSRGGQIEFDNPSDGNVEIALFNSLNKQVAVLQSGWLKAGSHSIRIPIEELPSGAYTYRIAAGNLIHDASCIIAK